jgi:HD-GYP domain-containing protein (c-di-GMP phosphodiesterase class II)
LIVEAIPLEARMIAVSDAFDAMTSLRPYNRPSPLGEILLEWRGAGANNSIQRFWRFS